jgi:hypothetical protein
MEPPANASSFRSSQREERRRERETSEKSMPPLWCRLPYVLIRDDLSQDLQPVGPLESALVDRIVGLLWRLRRVERIEAGILAWRYHGVLRERARMSKFAAEQRLMRGGQDVTLDTRKHALASCEESHQASCQKTDMGTLGEAVVLDSGGADSLSKLSRYETTLERSLHRTLHELQRLQSARQGKEVPAPLALDIDVTGIEKA